MMLGPEAFKDMTSVRSLGTSTQIREAYFLHFAKDIKAALSKTPVMVTGGFRSKQVMEAALAGGDADMIGLGRPLCGMPDACKRMLKGEIDTMPRYEGEDLRLPWYLSWLQYVMVGNLIKLGATQAWTCNSIIRMGQGKPPTTEVNLLGGIKEYEKHDQDKARALLNLDTTGSFTNAPTKKGCCKRKKEADGDQLR
mmetsp:Transcript_107700/g.246642  ORF Transcript_107700/g.246642 Transcript_107700/m.246642 type:complete len:196 (-) Transcript_107700:259-846(-)